MVAEIITFIANALVLLFSASPFVAVVIADIIVFGLIAASFIIPFLGAGGLAGGGVGAAPLSSSAAKRTQMIREPVTSQKIIYGEIRISGPMIFIDATVSNRYHHIVIALAGHECQKIGTVYLNDNPIFSEQINVNGNVIAGIYNGKVRIKKHLGSNSQIADADLVSEVTKWTSEHRGRGICYIYIRIDFDRDIFPTGLPNVSAIIQGKKVLDTRDSVTRFSPNPAMCIRDYLVDNSYGAGVDSADIDQTFFEADANSCEEFVLSGKPNHDVDSINTSTDEFLLNGTSLKFTNENKIRLTSPNFLTIPGTSLNFASSPDAAVLDIVGNIDLQVRMGRNFSGTPTNFLVNKFHNANGSRSYALLIVGSSKLRITWTPDGLNSLLSIESTIDIPFTSGVHYVRGTLKVDDGAGGREAKFFTSEDGISWTQFGATVTQSGTTSIFSGDRVLEIGRVDNQYSDVDIYRVRVFDGIEGEGGTLVFDADFTKEVGGTVSFNEDANNAVVTINQSGSPQAEIVGILPTGFSLLTDYFVIVSSIAGRVIKLAATREDATAGTPIDVVDSGTGTHTLTREVQHEVISVDTINDALLLNEDVLTFQTGDKLQITTTGTPPAGLAVLTDYFCIVFHEQSIVDDDGVIKFRAGIKLATNYLNSLSGVAINITSGGAGTHNVFKIAEPRFTCNGMIDTVVSRFNNISDLLTSMGGSVTKIGGTWKSYAAIFRTAVASFSEEDVLGTIVTPTKVSRGSRFNRVRGTYVSPKNFWEPADYPSVTKTAFQVQDNNEVIDLPNFDLPFTTRTQTAQRLAQIKLKRARNEEATEIKLKLKGIEVQAGNNIKFSNSVRGWTDKIFNIQTSTFLPDKDSNGSPILVSNLVLKSEASADYDFDPDVDEVILDGGADSDLPSAFFIEIPSGLLIVEEIYEGRAGAGVKTRIKVSWNEPQDALSRFFQVEHKLNTDPNFTKHPSTQDVIFNIDDIKPGIYDVRVKGVNNLGLSSAYVSGQIEVFGLLAEPENPQNMTITIVGGSAYIRWDQVADLDVRVGGQILFRHSRKLTGATWQESVSIGEQVGGAETLVVLPLKSGSYLAKSKDSLGVLSLTVSLVTTKQASIQDYTTSGTINEHPNFAGVHNGTVRDPSNNLRLIGGVLFDSWPDVDLVTDFDIGPDGISLTEGIYTFAAAFNLGAVVKRRVTTTINAININIFLFIDDRIDLMDDWTDFDQAGVDAPADAVIWMRQTDDDPTGSPVFGPYERIESVEVEAWGLEFQCRLKTTSKDHNFLVDELTVKQESLL